MQQKQQKLQDIVDFQERAAHKVFQALSPLPTPSIYPLRKDPKLEIYEMLRVIRSVTFKFTKRRITEENVVVALSTMKYKFY